MSICPPVGLLTMHVCSKWQVRSIRFRSDWRRKLIRTQTYSIEEKFDNCVGQENLAKQAIANVPCTARHYPIKVRGPKGKATIRNVDLVEILPWCKDVTYDNQRGLAIKWNGTPYYNWHWRTAQRMTIRLSHHCPGCLQRHLRWSSGPIWKHNSSLKTILFQFVRFLVEYAWGPLWTRRAVCLFTESPIDDHCSHWRPGYTSDRW